MIQNILNLGDQIGPNGFRLQTTKSSNHYVDVFALSNEVERWDYMIYIIEMIIPIILFPAMQKA